MHNIIKITTPGVLLFLLLSYGSAPGQEESYKFNHITTEHGLSSNTVYWIFKDSLGFMWFSTNIGLCRYDGYNMKVFTSDPADSTSLSSNYLYSEIYVDRDGYIWIGTYDNGLCRFDPAVERFTRYEHDPFNDRSIDHHHVWTIYQDRSGTIWIGTSASLNRFEGNTGTFEHWSRNPNDRSDISNLVYSMLDDNSGTFWVTTGKGVAIFDREKKNFSDFRPPSPFTEQLSNQLVFKIIQDRDGDYWFGAEHGLFRYKSNSETLDFISPDPQNKSALSGSLVYGVLQDPFEKDIFWITSFRGLNKLNKRTGEIHWILNDPGNPNSLGSNEINNTIIDEAGQLWVATENAGVAVTNLLGDEQKRSFSHIMMGSVIPDTLKHSATCFLENGRGSIWAGTGDGMLYEYDQSLQLKTVYRNLLEVQDTDKHPAITSLLADPYGNLLVGTSGNGLIIFNTKTRKGKRCEFASGGSSSLNSVCLDLIYGNDGILWVGTEAGLYKGLQNKPGNFNLELVDQEPLRSVEIQTLCRDLSNNLWIGTLGKGLFCLSGTSTGERKFISYQHENGNPQSLSSNMVFKVFLDSRGSLWIGTALGLNKFNPENQTFHSFQFPLHPGINSIYSIEEDGEGKFWFTTEAGLVCYDPYDGSGRSYKIYSMNDGLPFKDISPTSLFKDHSGRLFLGSKIEYGNGFFSFHPGRLKRNLSAPSIILTDFSVMNETFPLDSSITMKKHIVLNYNENFFSFEFAALNYRDPQKNQYAYMLEGIDESWNYTGNRRFANYTDIKSGKYIFRVKGSNNDGLWNDQGTSVHITIKPPPWRTWWAYSIYILILIALITAWRQYDLNRQEIKHKLEIERLEREKLKEMDHLKSTFFANISHEFRTPLTLILGIMDKISHRESIKEIDEDIKIARRNAFNLHKLVDELLNLSKLEAGQMKLHAREEDVVALVKEYSQFFESLAKKKKIIFTFTAEQESLIAYVDTDKLEKILFNLLSNAFKFTEAGGVISVTVCGQQSAVSSQQSTVRDKGIADHRPPTANCQSGFVTITVTDTGSGITPEHLTHIFDRFYQADDSATRRHEGTGIGLALTKELVLLHHGEIKVTSEPGKGSTFSVLLPLGKDHLSKEEIMKADIPETAIRREIMSVTETTAEGVPAEGKKPLITDTNERDDQAPILLLVEDNKDLRHFMRGFLAKSYTLFEAENGIEGWNKALDHVPDLVVSDVMMPGMSGFKLCSKLKNDERTCHIPVILLTAKAAMEDRIEGFETGADDFITKPFEQQELLVRIQNLIRLRKKLKSVFLQNLGSLSRLTDSNIASMDKKFMQKVLEIIESHLTDADFSIESFSRELGMSRGQLHRKLTALVGHSPSDFLRTIRLNRAALMIKSRAGNIAEIAYDVGFNNPSYFSECFKKQFGMLPSEYGSSG